MLSMQCRRQDQLQLYVLVFYSIITQSLKVNKECQNLHCNQVGCYDLQLGVVPQALPNFSRILRDLRGPTDKALAADK